MDKIREKCQKEMENYFANERVHEISYNEKTEELSYKYGVDIDDLRREFSIDYLKALYPDYDFNKFNSKMLDILYDSSFERGHRQETVMYELEDLFKMYIKMTEASKEN